MWGCPPGKVRGWLKRLWQLLLTGCSARGSYLIYFQQPSPAFPCLLPIPALPLPAVVSCSPRRVASERVGGTEGLLELVRVA